MSTSTVSSTRIVQDILDGRTAQRTLSGFLRDPIWLLALLAVICAALGFRSFVLFRTAIPAGIDAAYYPVQARALLEHGTLEWTDVPFIFALNAVVAKCAMWVTGWDIDTAVLWASRIIDAAGEPCAAIAVFCTVWIFARGARRAIPGAIAASCIAVLSPPMARMLGDFEKQSLAMAFMAATFVAAWYALRASGAHQPRTRRVVVALLFFVLTGLTHVGTFAATALGLCLLVGIWMLRGGMPRGSAIKFLALGAASALVIFAAIWWIAPRKGQAIIDAPGKMFAGSSQRAAGGGRPGAPREPSGFGGMNFVPQDFPPQDFPPQDFPPQANNRPDSQRPNDQRPPGRPGGGVAGEVVLTSQGWLIVALCGSALLIWATRALRRIVGLERTIARSDEAFAYAMFLTALALSCPWLSGDYLMRLVLMAPIPLALAVGIVLVAPLQHDVYRLRRSYWLPLASCAASIGVCFIVVSPAIILAQARGMVMIDESGIAQLRAWRNELKTDQRTLISARHGLEFWAGFALATRSQQSKFTVDDFDNYDRLLIVIEQGGRGRPGGMANDRGGPADMRNDMRAVNSPDADTLNEPQEQSKEQSSEPSDAMRPSASVQGGQTGRPDSRRRREALAQRDAEDRGAQQQRADRTGLPDRQRGPMGPGQLPPGATIVAQSQRFIIWEVPKSARDWYQR